MVVCINFADNRYKSAQQLNSKTALKWGADRVIEYSPNDIDEGFQKKNEYIFRNLKGYGYWLWKPYFIFKSLSEIEYGDYLMYTDSGSAFVNRISYLIDAMEKQNDDIMCFSINQNERTWTKRDTLILMEADDDKYLNSNQICATYIIIKKTDKSLRIVSEYLRYSQDSRILTDDVNVMGTDNYKEFRGHRHDQSIWSILCKKNDIEPYRDPSQYGLNESDFSSDILSRSSYPQIIESHRNAGINYEFELSYYSSFWSSVKNSIYKFLKKCKYNIKRMLKKTKAGV